MHEVWEAARAFARSSPTDGVPFKALRALSFALELDLSHSRIREILADVRTELERETRTKGR